MNNNYKYAILPLELITNPKYDNLNSNEKLLYTLLLNRKKMSQKNIKSFSDSKGVFIYYSNGQIQKHLKCSEPTAISSLNNLEQIGLIHKEYKKNGLPLKIYVNDIRAGGGKPPEIPSETPQKRFEYSPNIHSKERTKPVTSQMKYEDKEVSFDVDKALTNKQKIRRNFGDSKIRKPKKED